MRMIVIWWPLANKLICILSFVFFANNFHEKGEKEQLD